jgi:hypothetical protein
VIVSGFFETITDLSTTDYQPQPQLPARTLVLIFMSDSCFGLLYRAARGMRRC